MSTIHNIQGAVAALASLPKEKLEEALTNMLLGLSDAGFDQAGDINGGDLVDAVGELLEDTIGRVLEITPARVDAPDEPDDDDEDDSDDGDAPAPAPRQA